MFSFSQKLFNRVLIHFAFLVAEAWPKFVKAFVLYFRWLGLFGSAKCPHVPYGEVFGSAKCPYAHTSAVFWQ